MKKKCLNNKGFSTIEILFMIVMISVMLIGGLALVVSFTNNVNRENFRKDTLLIVSIAKNAYINQAKIVNNPYIVSKDNKKVMCISVDGLKDNEYIKGEYLKDYDGYILIEDDGNEVLYKMWIENKKLVMNGEEEISFSESKNLKKILTKYDKQKLEYDGICINDRLE